MSKKKEEKGLSTEELIKKYGQKKTDFKTIVKKVSKSVKVSK